MHQRSKDLEKILSGNKNIYFKMSFHLLNGDSQCKN